MVLPQPGNSRQRREAHTRGFPSPVAHFRGHRRLAGEHLAHGEVALQAREYPHALNTRFDRIYGFGFSIAAVDDKAGAPLQGDGLGAIGGDVFVARIANLLGGIE
jgi:hypothetical protein